jgi:ribokinase
VSVEVKPFDVCVVGSFMKDLVARAPRRPRTGETLRGDGFEEFLGGKGLNQAVAAARSGARTAMVGRLGADRYGDEFAELLAAEGIDARCVLRHSVIGTGVGLPVVEPDGSNSIIIVPRANDTLTVDDIEAAEVIRQCRVLVVQLELPVQTAAAAMRIAREAGAITMLNPAPSMLLPSSFQGAVDVLVANEVEAEQLTGLTVGDDSRLGVARKLYEDYSSTGAVLTLGAQGAVVATAGGVQWLAPHRVQVVDTVGAGDAFCGALAAKLARGSSLAEAVGFANAAGALATTTPGAAPAMPRLDQIEALTKIGRQRAESVLESVVDV